MFNAILNLWHNPIHTFTTTHGSIYRFDPKGYPIDPPNKGPQIGNSQRLKAPRGTEANIIKAGNGLREPSWATVFIKNPQSVDDLIAFKYDIDALEEKGNGVGRISLVPLKNQEAPFAVNLYIANTPTPGIKDWIPYKPSTKHPRLCSTKPSLKSNPLELYQSTGPGNFHQLHIGSEIIDIKKKGDNPFRKAVNNYYQTTARTS